MEKPNFRHFAAFLLRAALAVPFLYAAVASILQPESWIGFFPSWLFFIPGTLLLTLFSLYQLALAFWLLSGKRTTYAAVLAAISLTGIIIFNLGALDIVFRDLGLLLAAVALAFLSKGGEKIPEGGGRREMRSNNKERGAG